MRKPLRKEFYPGWEVSRDGKIYHQGVEKKVALFGNGYPLVRIPGLNKILYVHRLVAQAFIPNPQNLPLVLHKNRNLRDTRVENLRWGTQKDNMADRKRDGCNFRPKLSDQQVLEIVNLLKSRKLTQREIAEKYNVTQSTISSINTGRTHFKLQRGHK